MRLHFRESVAELDEAREKHVASMGTGGRAGKVAPAALTRSRALEAILRLFPDARVDADGRIFG